MVIVPVLQTIEAEIGIEPYAVSGDSIDMVQPLDFDCNSKDIGKGTGIDKDTVDIGKYS